MTVCWDRTLCCAILNINLCMEAHPWEPSLDPSQEHHHQSVKAHDTLLDNTDKCSKHIIVMYDKQIMH